MSEMKQMASICLLGDVVGSRLASDRQVLHVSLQEALDGVNRRWPADVRITVGDEFQGVFATLGQALAASVAIRLALLPKVDVRFGLGRGETEVLADTPRVEDGPGWWAARAAIEQTKQMAEGVLAQTRTRFVDEQAPDLCAAVNAALAGQDLMISRLDETGLSVLRGMLSEHSQAQMAHSIGISASAVSQRVRRNGIAVVVAIAQGLSELK